MPIDGIHSYRPQGHPCLAGPRGPLEQLSSGCCTGSSAKHHLTCPSAATDPRGLRDEAHLCAKRRPVFDSPKDCARFDGWSYLCKCLDKKSQEMHSHRQVMPRSWGMSSGSSTHAQSRHLCRRQDRQCWPQPTGLSTVPPAVGRHQCSPTRSRQRSGRAVTHSGLESRSRRGSPSLDAL